MSRHRGLIALLLVAWAFTHCDHAAAPSRDASPDWPALPAGALLVPIETVAADPSTGFAERARTVIDGQEAWNAFWMTYEANRLQNTEPPRIDFQSRRVVAAMMGQRSTGGYSIAITAVYQTDDRLLVRVLESSPGAGCVLTQAITAPATAASIPRSELPLEFVEGRATVPCG